MRVGRQVQMDVSVGIVYRCVNQAKINKTFLNFTFLAIWETFSAVNQVRTVIICTPNQP